MKATCFRPKVASFNRVAVAHAVKRFGTLPLHSLGPIRTLRFKRHSFVRERVRECDALGQQAERRGIDGVSLSVAELPLGEIGRIADDGPAEMPEVNANLIGTAREWNNLQQ